MITWIHKFELVIELLAWSALALLGIGLSFWHSLTLDTIGGCGLALLGLWGVGATIVEMFDRWWKDD